VRLAPHDLAQDLRGLLLGGRHALRGRHVDQLGAVRGTGVAAAVLLTLEPSAIRHVKGQVELIPGRLLVRDMHGPHDIFDPITAGHDITDGRAAIIVWMSGRFMHTGQVLDLRCSKSCRYRSRRIAVLVDETTEDPGAQGFMAAFFAKKKAWEKFALFFCGEGKI
jgi:hypothetical protein